MRRIGVLLPYAEDDPEAKSHLSAITQELKRLGWSQDHNIRIDARFGAMPDQFPALAKELAALQPDALLSESTPAAAALKQETRSIPIVFIGVSDPIGSGFVTSLARPEGNLTGMMQYESGIVGKWLEMLKEVAPRLTRVALIANPKFRGYAYFLRFAQAAAPTLAIELIPKQISDDAADIERTIEAFAQMPEGGLLISPRATGRCSTPAGTTKTSPELRVMVRSCSSMSSVPLSAKKKSSVSSCLCRWNGPSSLATIMSLLL